MRSFGGSRRVFVILPRPLIYRVRPARDEMSCFMRAGDTHAGGAWQGAGKMGNVGVAGCWCCGTFAVALWLETRVGDGLPCPCE